MGNVIILEPQEKQPIRDYIKHDLPGLVKKRPKSLSWEDHETVIVGSYSFSGHDGYFYVDDQRQLEVNALKEQLEECGDSAYGGLNLGNNVFQESGVSYPRDAFLSFGHVIIGGKRYSDFKNITSGGFYIFGTDFVIVSKALEKQFSQRTIRNFWEAFGIDKVYFLPVSRKVADKNVLLHHGHLDYTIGSIPWLGVYTADEDHLAEQKTVFEMVERENGVEFTPVRSTRIVHGYQEKYRGGGTRVPKKVELWPNCFFAYRKSGDEEPMTHLLYNQLTPEIRHRLGFLNIDGKFQVHFIESRVPIISSIGNSGGSIHCMTNTAPDRQTYQEFRSRMNYDKQPKA